MAELTTVPSVMEEAPPIPSAPKAFRCKKCGHLEPAAHAGDLAVPLACSVCGAGVIFKTQELAARLNEPGLTAEQVKEVALLMSSCSPADKRLDPDNWEVLAYCSEERLAEIGLCGDDVGRHHRKGEAPADGKHVEAKASDGTASQDKAG